MIHTQVRLLLSTLLISTAVLEIRGSWFADDDDWKTEALAKFKSFAEQTATEDFMKDEAYLLRLLKALDFDLDVAFSNLQTALRWRKTNNMSSIIYDKFTPFFIQEFPVFLDGSEDKQGRPILYLPLGRYNLRKAALAGQHNEIVRYVTRALEIAERHIHMKRLADRSYRQTSDIIGIIDLQGFNMVSTACWKCLKFVPEMVPILEGYYRQLFNKIIFINAPKIFDVMLNLMKSLMTVATRDSIEVYDPNSEQWKKALLERVAPENLPTFYGGMRPKSRGNEVEKMVILDVSRQKILPFLATKQELRATDSTIHFSSTAEYDEIERLSNSITTTTHFPGLSKSGQSEVSEQLVSTTLSTARTDEFEVSEKLVNTTFNTVPTKIGAPEEVHIRHHKHSHHHHYSKNGKESSQEALPHSLSAQSLVRTQNPSEKAGLDKKPLKYASDEMKDDPKVSVVTDGMLHRALQKDPNRSVPPERTSKSSHAPEKAAMTSLNNQSSGAYSCQTTSMELLSLMMIVVCIIMPVL